MKAHLFTLKIYEARKQFPKEELYGLTNQLRRAALSIRLTLQKAVEKILKNEFAHFLNTALGSANETEYFLIFSKDLKYLHEENFLELSEHINEIKGMLISSIGKVRMIKT